MDRKYRVSIEAMIRKWVVEEEKRIHQAMVEKRDSELLEKGKEQEHVPGTVLAD